MLAAMLIALSDLFAIFCNVVPTSPILISLCAVGMPNVNLFAKRIDLRQDLYRLALQLRGA